MWQKVREHLGFISIICFYLVLFVPFLGQVHLFDWDEINFAEAAREMIVTGDWLNVQINYEPFWEKPPLFIWLQACSMSIFGVNEYAARFPNVVIGLVTLFVLYFSVYRRYGKQAGVFTLLMYIGSVTPHFYFKSGIIDPLFNLFIFCTLLYLVRSTETKRIANFFWAGLFLGLAVITKGPVCLLIVGLTGLVYQLYYKINFYTPKGLLFLLGGLLVFPALFFGIQVYQSGWWFLQEFIIYQIDLFRYPIASHGQPFYYHFVVLLLGCFPLFVLALKPIASKTDIIGDANYVRWMKVLFWVVLIVFSSVTTKIVHYSSMCYIPLAIVGGVWLSRYTVLTRVSRILLGVVGVVWVLILAACGSFYLVDINKLLSKHIQDNFVLAQLQTEVSWSFVPIILAMILAGVLFRALIKPSKISISSFLVTNSLVITLLMVSFVPQVEQTVQGNWITQLGKYKGKEMAHFTFGFKSYAHLFYTEQASFDDLKEAKETILKRLKLGDSHNLNEEERLAFHVNLRDYVVRETDIPISISAKVQKFEEIREIYPELNKVYQANGYGVYERAKAIGK
jgi:4-amino-4-deoxy-L-arabinose transferase-like glycosyltransferase